jgi:type III secretion protein U
MSDDKTEEPTDHKLKKAREEGNIPSSEDLKGFISLAMSLAIIYSLASSTYLGFYAPAGACFSSGFELKIGSELFTKACGEVLHYMVTVVIVIFALEVGVAFATYFIINKGLVIPKEAIKFKFESLNAIQNLMGIFKKENLTTAFMSVFKEMLFYSIFMFLLSVYGKQMVYEAFCGEKCSGHAEYDFLMRLILIFLLIALVFSGVDYPLRVYFHKKSLMMDHKEIKDEHKEMEGNPEVKHERENFRWELLNGTPTGPGNATFFIKSREHIVGVRYIREESPAPMIVCVGKTADSVDRIFAVANTRRCLIINNHDFGAGVAKKAQVGRPVPLEFVGDIRKAIVALRQHEAKHGPSHKPKQKPAS